MEEKCYSATEEYPDLENHYSHMAHCLTEEIYKRMSKLETSSGFSIDDAIQIGIDNPGNPYHMTVGCVAGDEESYEIFKEFFDQVIEAKHNGYKNMAHPKPNRNVVHSSRLDNSFILSCQVRSIRNLRGFCLPSHCTRAERRKIEGIVKNACLNLAGDFKGKYVPVKELTKDDRLVSHAKTANFDHDVMHPCMMRDWPDGRSIFASNANDFFVEINMQDHLRFVSIQEDGNLILAFSRCCEGLRQVENFLNKDEYHFMHSAARGYITTCPGNLGTGMQVLVRMRIPKLLEHFRIEEIFSRLCLKKAQKARTDEKGFDSPVEISNLCTLGVTETDTIKNVIDGVAFLAESEKKLEKDQSIEMDINRLRK